MIYIIPHVTSFGSSWSNLKIQWEVVHLYPLPVKKNGGSLNVFLDGDMLQYIHDNNTPEAWQWMTGGSGTIIWKVYNKKNPKAIINKRAFMPAIAIGGNQIEVEDEGNGFGKVIGMSAINKNVTPANSPTRWHRIWCVTKLPHGQVSAPHDPPHGPAYLPILDVSAFKRSRSLHAGVTYIKI